MRLLVVEDDPDIANLIRHYLEKSGHTVQNLTTGAGVLTRLRADPADLVILDLGLPHIDGIEVIRQSRRAGASVPILVLSARERAADRTLGLDVGADDYVGKPFDSNELLARVRALLRRSAGRVNPKLELGELVLDPATLSVTWRGRQLDLPRREFALLRLLMENHGKVISRESVQQGLYGWDEDVASNAVDVHVHQLRRKLHPALIRTLRGVGYALDERAAASAIDQDPVP